MNHIRASYIFHHAVMVTLVLALSGCTFTRLMTTQSEKPAFTFTGSELVETSQSRVIVNFLFSAHNPNEAGLKNVIVSYELYVEERKFAKGDDIPVDLNPKGDTEIKVPATIVYTDLLPVLGSIIKRILSGQKTIPITIVAVFSGKPALYGEAGKEEPVSFEKRLTRTVDIPLPQERRTMGQ
jgi:LEA14-like dessication related protein